MLDQPTAEAYQKICKALESNRLALDAEMAFTRLLKHDVAELTKALTVSQGAFRSLGGSVDLTIEVAEKHGWNGVDNSKLLHGFLDEQLTAFAEVTELLEWQAKRRVTIRSASKTLWLCFEEESGICIGHGKTPLESLLHGRRCKA